jgi:catalase
VSLLISEAGAKELEGNPALRDFVSDAGMHKKFVGFTAAAQPMLKRILVVGKPDAGMLELSNAASAKGFVKACADLRFWKRR